MSSSLPTSAAVVLVAWPPLPLFSVEFCELCTATARGQGSPDHQPKKGPPDCPGQTSAWCDIASCESNSHQAPSSEIPLWNVGR